MKYYENLGDIRQTSFCAYCGNETETRDHVPSKVFLDKPYPSNLPVVFACNECNTDFSLDEEYLACFIECVIAGTVDIEKIHREKIQRILLKKPKLVSKIEKARRNLSNREIAFESEENRFEKIALKLGRGHAVYELNDPKLSEPLSLSIFPLMLLTNDERKYFEKPPVSDLFPEVGSRAMQRNVLNMESSSWINVQDGRYRFLVSVANGTIIRFVIREYLGCEIIWD